MLHDASTTGVATVTFTLHRLVPALERAGFRVLIRRRWFSTGGELVGEPPSASVALAREDPEPIEHKKISSTGFVVTLFVTGLILAAGACYAAVSLATSQGSPLPRSAALIPVALGAIAGVAVGDGLGKRFLLGEGISVPRWVMLVGFVQFFVLLPFIATAPWAIPLVWAFGLSMDGVAVIAVARRLL